MKSTEMVVSEVGSATGTFDAEKYFKMLEQGPRMIKDLLAEFKLPATQNGRGKIRKANEAFNEANEGKKQIVPVMMGLPGQKARRGFMLKVLSK